MNKRVISKIQNIFTFFMDEIDAGKNPLVIALQNYYGDVCYMQTSPFNALLVTILSQNKTGEATRKAYFSLSSVAEEISPEGVLKLDKRILKNAIRIAGPYKLKYLIETSKK